MCTLLHVCSTNQQRIVSPPKHTDVPHQSHTDNLTSSLAAKPSRNPANPIFLCFLSSLTLIRSVLKRRWIALIEYVVPANPPAAPCCVSVLWTGHRSRCTRCYVFINTSSSRSPEKLFMHFITAWTDSRLRLPAWLRQMGVPVFKMQAAGTVKSLVMVLYGFVNPCCGLTHCFLKMQWNARTTNTVFRCCFHFISRHVSFVLHLLCLQ